MTWMDRGELVNMPGIPEPSADEEIDALNKLNGRKDGINRAKDGLTEVYHIDAEAWTAKDWMFGKGAPRGATLANARQFAMGWTTLDDVHAVGLKLLDDYENTLVSVDAANKAFWPNIAQQGTAYNLLILRPVTDERWEKYYLFWVGGQDSEVGKTFGTFQQQGRLYEIDLIWLRGVGAYYYDDRPLRFNVGTQTLLVQDETDKWVFEPGWILVASEAPEVTNRVYSPFYKDQTDGSWLYALQAVKSSVTLYGIWFGHVYHWHMVTAAMQGAMFDAIGDSGHPVRQLLDPQSKYLIPFDYILLDGASPAVDFSDIAPPSAIDSVKQFMKWTDAYAKGREFFDDDPLNEISSLNEADFTKDEPWDMFPAAQRLLKIWDICQRYVTDVVKDSYPTDRAVSEDSALQRWLEKAADPDVGNIRGLPNVNSVETLAQVLTSLVYRVTAHGYSRLVWAPNPPLTFVANYPPCLQSTTIPYRTETVTDAELLKYLPNTATIGEMVEFYFAFSFTEPYEPLIPVGGVETEPFFGDDWANPRNKALLQFRKDMAALMVGSFNAAQWPLNIET